MEQETVSGYCYVNEEFLNTRKVGYIILMVLAALVIVSSVWMKQPMILLIDLYLLIVLAVAEYFHRYAYDSFARFALSDAGIRTTSKSAKMCRCFSWGEVSVIQITRMEGTRALPPMDCYVFVRGGENALIKCQAMETFGYIFSNPNRIAIPINERTQPFVTAIAEKYGIPTERSYLG